MNSLQQSRRGAGWRSPSPLVLKPDSGPGIAHLNSGCWLKRMKTTITARIRVAYYRGHMLRQANKYETFARLGFGDFLLHVVTYIGYFISQNDHYHQIQKVL